MCGRILVIDHSTPKPDEDSGSASTFSYLQILRRAGWNVTFAPCDLTEKGRYSRNLKRIGITTLSRNRYKSMANVIKKFGPESDIILFYRAACASPLFDLARREAVAAKIIFHPVDLHFLRMQRQSALTGDVALSEAADAMRATELDLIKRADATIVVSTKELNLLQELVPEATVHQIPILRETPLDPWFARHSSLRGLNTMARWFHRPKPPRQDILFIGGFAHTPNVDAIEWFVHEVWPKVQSKGFQHRFIIAGSKTPHAIAKLASDKIVVRGYVEDLAPLFASVRLTIAPLRYGGGIKGKIVTSLSHRVPVVATSIAAEGMGLTNEKDILIADAPDQLADQIVRLYDDVELWQRLSSNGYDAFLRQFSQASGGAKVLAVLDSVRRNDG